MSSRYGQFIVQAIFCVNFLQCILITAMSLNLNILKLAVKNQRTTLCYLIKGFSQTKSCCVANVTVLKYLNICTVNVCNQKLGKTTCNAHLRSGHTERVQVIWSIRTSSSHKKFQTERNVLAITRYKQELVRRGPYSQSI